MLPYTAMSSLYGKLTNDANSANLSFGDVMMNEGMRVMLGDLPWPFLETTTTALTVSGTQAYTMPGNMDKLVHVYIQVGTYKYNPVEVANFDDWDNINNPSGVQGDNVSFYFIVGNQINFWPIPATSGSTITYEYLQAARDISVADYTTGSIVSIANGATAVTGSGTSWTAGMVGKFIRITAGNGANLGDGLWYKIAAVGSATTLTLSAAYTGATIAAGSAAYTIGDCMLIPEKYQLGPVYYAVAEFWRKQNDNARADRFQAKFDDIARRLKEDEGRKTSQSVIDYNSDYQIINPNLNKSAT